jgi:hypothetical protein
MVKVKHGGLLPALILFLASLAMSEESVLVFHPAGDKFVETIKGIKDGLGAGYSVSDQELAKDASVSVLAGAVKKVVPKAVVLMDNSSIRLWREYQQQAGDTSIPAVALMGIMIDKAVAGVPNATGISYEVPAVTVFVDLRSLLKQPIQNIGVIHRASMEDFIAKQKGFCEPENIHLKAFRVDDKSSAEDGLRAGLDDLLGRQDVDALWVLNDNFFLNAKLLKEVWLPAAAKYRKPIVVGVESLIQSSLNFGVYAVLPDHYALGSQAANLLLELQDNGWIASGRAVDQPLSVLKYLNTKLSRKTLQIDEEKLKEIDRQME